MTIFHHIDIIYLSQGDKKKGGYYMNTKKQGTSKKQAHMKEQKKEAIARLIGIILVLYLFLCYHDIIVKQGTPTQHGEPLENWNILQTIFEQ